MGWHVAVLGTGGWSQVHIKALAATEHVDRVTLAGRNNSALAELAARFPIVTTTTSDFQSVFDDPSIELVHICLPHYLHADVSCEALQAGKHVICEKPAATSLSDFDRIVQAAAVKRPAIPRRHEPALQPTCTAGEGDRGFRHARSTVSMCRNWLQPARALLS